jgi:hypothetical protein
MVRKFISFVLVLVIGISVSLGVLIPGDSFAQASQLGYRRVADNIYGVHGFSDILAISKSYCITGVESMSPANTQVPLWVWVVPKNHAACTDVPRKAPDGPEYAGINYFGGGIFTVKNLDVAISVLSRDYLILDTEALSGSDGNFYVVLVRNRPTSP